MTTYQLQQRFSRLLSAFPIPAVTQALPLTFLLKYCEKVQRQPILQGNWNQLQTTPTVGLAVQINEALSQLANENSRLAFIQRLPVTNLNSQLWQACLQAVDQTPLDQAGFNQLIQYLATLAGNREQVVNMQTLASLAVKLLDIRQGKIYDGTAAFGLKLTTLAQVIPGKIQVSAHDRDPLRWLVGGINFYINQIVGTFALGDVLTKPAFCESGEAHTFDYALMTAPFSASFSDQRIQQDRYHRFRFGIPNRGTADLLFIQNTIAALNPTGRAILVVSTGLLNRASQGEATIKQQLVAADLLETIITLPTGIWSTPTGGSVAIVIVAKHKRPALSNKLHLIDASGLGHQTTTGLTLTERDVQQLVSWYDNLTQTTAPSKVIANQDIKKGNLDFHQYFETQRVASILGPVTVDSRRYERLPLPKVRLKDVATLFRGMNLTKNQLLPLGVGDWSVLRLADVSASGHVHLTGLTGITGDAYRLQKYRVYPGDVVVTGRGTQQKIAVIPETKQKLVLSSDFIGIHLQASMDPWYVKAFFDSPFGSFYLAKLRRGGQRTIINYRDLADLLILDTPLEKQHKVGQAFHQADQDYQQQLIMARQQRQQRYQALYQELGVWQALTTNRD